MTFFKVNEEDYPVASPMKTTDEEAMAEMLADAWLHAFQLRDALTRLEADLTAHERTHNPMDRDHPARVAARKLLGRE